MRLYLTQAFCGLLALGLGSCTLTTEHVEPALPVGQVNGDNTLVYHAAGVPVVAHNYSTLFGVLLSFFGDGRAVTGKLYRYDSTLVVRAADVQNTPPDGGRTHLLELALPGFRGVGTYAPRPADTSYRELPVPYDPQVPSPAWPLAPAVPAQVLVTRWDTATRRLQGTFRLAVAAPGATPLALTDGSFDLTVDP